MPSVLVHIFTSNFESFICLFPVLASRPATDEDETMSLDDKYHDYFRLWEPRESDLAEVARLCTIALLGFVSLAIVFAIAIPVYLVACLLSVATWDMWWLDQLHMKRRR